MKLRAARVVAFAALPLTIALLATPALAQEDEEGRFSIGVGAGLVQTTSGSDPYFTANLRSRIGYRVAGEERQGSVFGFVEPEVGYWTSDRVNNGRKLETKDTLLGVNIGGAVRLRVFEYFIAGGVGYHMFDRDVASGLTTRSVSDGSVGVNAQFGFDIRMSETVSMFGVGRFDLVQSDDDSGSNDDNQTKAYLGLRFHL